MGHCYYLYTERENQILAKITHRETKSRSEYKFSVSFILSFGSNDLTWFPWKHSDLSGQVPTYRSGGKTSSIGT